VLDPLAQAVITPFQWLFETLPQDRKQSLRVKEYQSRLEQILLIELEWEVLNKAMAEAEEKYKDRPANS
jgi:hypothetical protein